jgi:EAL domain-containing protein (putative c-di-GMP-specific phosphodiesterase class I)
MELAYVIDLNMVTEGVESDEEITAEAMGADDLQGFVVRRTLPTRLSTWFQGRAGAAGQA